MMLEEMNERDHTFEYDAWRISIGGDQFSKDFVAVNPNSKIPAILHYVEGEERPIPVFESASILMYLCEHFPEQTQGYPLDHRLCDWCSHTG